MATTKGKGGSLTCGSESWEIGEWELSTDDSQPGQGEVIGSLPDGATFSVVAELTPEGLAWLYELEHPDCWN